MYMNGGTSGGCMGQTGLSPFEVQRSRVRQHNLRPRVLPQALKTNLSMCCQHQNV